MSKAIIRLLKDPNRWVKQAIHQGRRTVEQRPGRVKCGGGFRVLGKKPQGGNY